MFNLLTVLQGLTRINVVHRVLATILALTLTSSVLPATAQIRVACVGDSITYGATIHPFKGNSYPDQLQSLLGSNYAVGNLDSSYGHSGTTMLKLSDNPYWNTTEYTTSTNFNVNKYVIMLGTNDSKPANWTPYGQYFVSNYEEMIAHYRNLAAHPTVYICLCPPVLKDGAYNISSANVENSINPDIRTIAQATGATLIDTHTPFVGHPEYLSDGIHPNSTGARVLAQTIYAAITP